MQGDAQEIWSILDLAIKRRKEDGSDQWQNGYPNPKIVQEDIDKGRAFVLTKETNIIAYAAVWKNDEPAYNTIIGAWRTPGDFLVIHRLAVSEKYLGKGFAKEMFLRIEEMATEEKIPSIRVDTNYDNASMLHIFDQLGYVYCGEVEMKGAPRKAFEKIL